MSPISRWLDPNLVEALNPLALGTRRVSQGLTSGLHRTAIRGSSLEFRQHRAYAAGDEPRRVDWRVLARSDRIFVKEFEAESNLRATFVLDASGSMRYDAGSKFDFAGRLAVALSYLVLAQQDRAGLLIAQAPRPVVMSPGSTAPQLRRMIEAVDRTRPAGPTALARALELCAERAERRSLVIIISDFLLPVVDLQPALSRLAFARHELVLLRILHPDEVHFPFERWMTFKGLEDERNATLDLAARRGEYLQRFEAHRKALQTLCARLSATFLQQSIDRPVLDAVRAVLHRKGHR